MCYSQTIANTFFYKNMHFGQKKNIVEIHTKLNAFLKAPVKSDIDISPLVGQNI